MILLNFYQNLNLINDLKLLSKLELNYKKLKILINLLIFYKYGILSTN